MIEQQQVEYDVYYQGSKNELFAMLYPLTGPSSPIFDHLQLSKIQYSNEDKSFEFTYNTKDFSNIDRQNQPIVYQSTSQQTHSNYFYSTYLPQEKAFVWRSVSRMIELRPSKVGNSKKQVHNKAKLNQKASDKKISEMQEQIGVDEGSKQLNLVKLQEDGNTITKQIESAPNQPLNKNWDISKEQYLHRLCQ